MNQHTDQSSRRLVRVAVVAAVLAAAALAPATSAAPLVREHYSGTDSWEDDGCGFTIHGEATFEGVFMLKQPLTDGAPPYLFDNYSVIVTLMVNGRTVTITNQALYKDLRITHVDGTVYQFVSIESGQPFVAVGDDGTVLFHYRGLSARGSWSTRSETPTWTTTCSSMAASRCYWTRDGIRCSTPTSALRWRRISSASCRLQRRC